MTWMMTYYENEKNFTNPQKITKLSEEFYEKIKAQELTVNLPPDALLLLKES